MKHIGAEAGGLEAELLGKAGCLLGTLCGKS